MTNFINYVDYNKNYNQKFIDKNVDKRKVSDSKRIMVDYTSDDGHTYTDTFNHVRPSSNPVTLWVERMLPEFFHRGEKPFGEILEASASMAAANDHRISGIRFQ